MRVRRRVARATIEELEGILRLTDRETDLFTAVPGTGDLDLEDRNALRRVAGLSTELADITEVEYRQLRLERVVEGL